MSALAVVRVYAHEGRTRRAARLLARVQRAVALQSVGPAELQLALVRAEVALQQGDNEAADSAARAALALARGREQRLEEGLALGLLGRCALAAGQAEVAAPVLCEALECLDAIGASRHADRLRGLLEDAGPLP
jgi:hypothetical protein